MGWVRQGPPGASKSFIRRSSCTSRQATKRNDRQYYGAALQSVQAGGKTLGAQLEILSGLENDLKAEIIMSDAGKAEVAADLARMCSLLQPGAETLEQLISIATRGLTTDTPVAQLDNRLRELDDHLLSIKGSANLTDGTRERLAAAVAQARTLVETLKARTQDLDALAGHGRLQGALRDVKDARDYVAARQGLAYATDKVAPALHGALLDHLNANITGPQDAVLLADIRAGNPEIIDMLLPGALWDELAYALKSSALNPATELALVNVQAQHERRQVAREMDNAMQSAAFKSSISKSLGKGKAEYAKLPANAFQALKADAALIGWFVQHAPNTLGERDLAMANWIRLSLHDTATGQPDSAKKDELFRQLRARGLDTQQMELHAAQGFRSSADVQACASHIRAFSKALQNSATAAAVDPRVRAAQVGMELLRGLGIRAASIDDPAIDAQARQLIDRALQAEQGYSRTVSRPAPRRDHAGRAGEQRPGFHSRGPRSGRHLPQQPDHEPHGRHGHELPVAQSQPCGKRRSTCCTNCRVTLAPWTSCAATRSGLKPVFGREAQKRREANEATLKAALAQLKPNQSITITFGTTVEVSASTPVLPGLSVGADMRADRHNSIRVSCTADAIFSVELLAGVSTREGGSLTTVMDALSLRLGASHQRDKGNDSRSKRSSGRFRREQNCSPVTD